MRNFTRLLLVFVFSLATVTMYAQAVDSTQAPVKVEPAVAAPAPSEPAVTSTPSVDTTPVAVPAATPIASTPVQPDTTQSVASDTTKHKKDRQNQTQFLKPDMESKTYNFYQRKEISQPLMPRYDLDSAVFQRGKKRGQTTTEISSAPVCFSGKA